MRNFIFVLSCCLAACGANPETGRRQLILVPASVMNTLGTDTYATMRQSEPISKDAALTATVVGIAKRVAAATDRDYDWEFTLFESDQVNAFCLPGGKVGIYTGILKVAQTNAGLAAVIGHEVAHAILNHGAERVSQNLAVASAGLALDQVLADDAKKPAILAALGVGAQFGVILPFSRQHETEADLQGLEYMAKAGYDPSAAVGLWERMAKLGDTPPELLSTHPDPARRAEVMKGYLSKVEAVYAASDKVPTTNLYNGPMNAH